MNEPRPWQLLLYGGFTLAAGSVSLLSFVRWRPDLYPEGLSSLFPAALLGLLAIVSGYLGVSPGPSYSNPSGMSADPGHRRRFLAAAALLLAGLAAMPFAGFPVVMLVFQSLLLRLVFGLRGLGWLLILPLVATAVIVVVFSRLLAIPLPRGVGWFYDLTALLA